jgi:hypothetical protein
MTLVLVLHSDVTRHLPLYLLLCSSALCVCGAAAVLNSDAVVQVSICSIDSKPLQWCSACLACVYRRFIALLYLMHAASSMLDLGTHTHYLSQSILATSQTRVANVSLTWYKQWAVSE